MSCSNKTVYEHFWIIALDLGPYLCKCWIKIVTGLARTRSCPRCKTLEPAIIADPDRCHVLRPAAEPQFFPIYIYIYPVMTIFYIEMQSGQLLGQSGVEP